MRIIPLMQFAAEHVTQHWHLTKPAASGLRGMVVVHVNGATLSCPLAASEAVRKVSEVVRARGAR